MEEFTVQHSKHHGETQRKIGAFMGWVARETGVSKSEETIIDLEVKGIEKYSGNEAGKDFKGHQY